VYCMWNGSDRYAFQWNVALRSAVFVPAAGSTKEDLERRKGSDVIKKLVDGRTHELNGLPSIGIISAVAYKTSSFNLPGAALVMYYVLRIT
jgi:hypothetical protein